MKPINKTINYIEEYLDYEDIRPMIKSKINSHLNTLKSQIKEIKSLIKKIPKKVWCGDCEVWINDDFDSCNCYCDCGENREEDEDWDCVYYENQTLDYKGCSKNREWFISYELSEDDYWILNEFYED